MSFTTKQHLKNQVKCFLQGAEKIPEEKKCGREVHSRKSKKWMEQIEKTQFVLKHRIMIE